MSAGVSLIWPNLGSQQNEFLNIFNTVGPKAGSRLNLHSLQCLPFLVSSHSSPLSILSLLSSLYSFSLLSLLLQLPSLFPALALKRNSNEIQKISSRFVSFVSKPLLTAQLLIRSPTPPHPPPCYLNIPLGSHFFPTFSFLLRGHGCGGNTQGNTSHTLTT